MKWMNAMAGMTILVVSASVAAVDSPDAGGVTLRKKAASWLKKNRIRAKDQDQLSQIIDQALAQGRNFNLALGSNLTKSGKATVAASWGGQLFVFPLSSKQAKALGLKAPSANLSVSGVNEDKRQSPDPIKLSQLTIKNNKTMDGSKPFEGQVNVQADGKVPEKVALRISYIKGETPKSSFQHFEDFPPKDKVINFSLKGMNEEEKDTKIKGPILVFVDLCTIQNTADGAKNTVLSNPLAVLVNVQ